MRVGLARVLPALRVDGAVRGLPGADDDVHDEHVVHFDVDVVHQLVGHHVVEHLDDARATVVAVAAAVQAALQRSRKACASTCTGKRREKGACRRACGARGKQCGAPTACALPPE
jgi:hypothetical protein